MAEIRQEDHGKKGRFVIYEDGELAGEMTYTWAGESRFIIDHTGVDERYGGKGFGKQLVMEAVAYARQKGIKILPLCPFAKRVFDKEPKLADVRF
ncbi:GNAT family N-acetyltransferase [Sunxiuqinia dokdonensis]|uniref:GNAT family acetyltransferase n=1 Tax=Sunxiuqinia dokdonensis TaxID=1409788 RepID=A0A0L8VDV8_9BACT|nr:GNAT family N-acetyltransferase [Sunxiuqinia dokdonensis]KOH46645.1 GNAT family acetyltransferase [Sunxiuqinia dokdonensis]